MRRHLESHGWDPTQAFHAATDIVRRPPPSVWQCAACRRRFGSVRGLFRHVRTMGHEAAPPQPK